MAFGIWKHECPPEYWGEEDEPEVEEAEPILIVRQGKWGSERSENQGEVYLCLEHGWRAKGEALGIFRGIAGDCCACCRERARRAKLWLGGGS